MRSMVGVAVLTLTLAGCAAVSRPADDELARVDRLVARGDYGAAMRAYESMMARHPAAPHVRVSRDALADLVAAQADVARLRDTLAAREGELARLRHEMQRLTQEADRLRADLETLKEIDLRKEPKRR